MALTLQIKHTTTPNNPPSSLAEGELSVGVADTPLPSLWVGGVSAPIQIIGTNSANGVVTYGALAAATGDVTFTITY